MLTLLLWCWMLSTSSSPISTWKGLSKTTAACFQWEASLEVSNLISSSRYIWYQNGMAVTCPDLQICTFTSLLEVFKYGVIKSSLKSSTGLLKGMQGNEDRSKNTRIGTWNWLIKGAIFNPRVRSVPWTALSSTSVCDSTSNPNISTYWGKILPPDCSKHLEKEKC